MIKHKFSNYSVDNKNLISLVIIMLFVVLTIPQSFATEVQSERKKEIKERTEKILASSEFAEKTKKKTIIETMAVGVKEIVEMIKEKVKKLMEKMKLPEKKAAASDAEMNPATAAFFKFAGITILMAALACLIYIFSRNFRKDRKIKIKEDRDILLSLRDSELVEEKAFEFADKGDLRQGIRYLYIALLLKFNEYDLIRIEKSKTNKQYMNELRETGFKSFEKAYEFTMDFNRYWYGNRIVEKDRFDYWKDGYDLLKKEVGT